MSAKAITLAAAILSIAACRAETFSPLGPTGLEVVHGPPALVSLGTELDTLLQVRVVDAEGHPRSGVAVTWHIVAGDGELIPGSDTSGADGLVTARWKFGMIPGPKQVQVQIPGADPLTLSTEARGFRAVQVTAGWSHGCGLDGDGIAWCFGGDSITLGNATAGTYTLRPTAVSGGHVFSEIRAGSDFTCGLSGGAVWCWGYNWGGALGQGPAFSVNSATPLQVPGLPAMRTIRAGGNTGCGLATDSTTWCWGGDLHGEAGGGGAVVGATQIATALKFIGLAVSADHVCGLAAGGAAYCWGANGLGALGDSGSSRSAPTTPVSGGHQFVSLVAAEDATCGRTAEGAAWCWGAGLYLPEMSGGRSTPLPVQIDFPANVAGVATGSLFAMGVGIGGQPYFRNRAGARPFDPPLDQLRIQQVAGQESYCAIGATGDVYCSGSIVDQIDCSSLPPYGCAPTGPIPLPAGGRVYGYPPFGD